MKILICDDHPLFREGLELVLSRLDANARLSSVADAEAALARVAADPDLDLVLLDIALPGLSGLDALERLRRSHPAVPVVILSASESPDDARAALERGASGFIPKSSRGAVLLGAVRLVLDGGVYVPPLLLDAKPAPLRARDDARRALTPRQLAVLRLIARGLTNAEIAHALGISGATVKNHLERIYTALDASNRTEAAMRMRELGLGEDD
jgi:DNA-binding NarL/FixJ family response regulator